MMTMNVNSAIMMKIGIRAIAILAKFLQSSTNGHCLIFLIFPSTFN
jgi:hypothetical protein